MFNSLEGDGIIENIYHFLWTKDLTFNTQHSIYIPQTIIYKYRKPLFWYFTSVVDHKLKKKNPDKLNKEHIKNVFLKNISKSGIVCYFIYKKESYLSKYESDKPTFEKTMKNMLRYINDSKSNNQTENTYNDLKSSRPQSSSDKNQYLKQDDYKINSSKYIIEYFNKKQFIEFLDNKPKSEEGILQKFEDPKGEYNCIYRIVWSPKLSLFEKCSNLKKLNDNHFDIYERAVTYDGEEFQTKIEPVKGRHIPQEMQQIALQIVSHIGNITFEKIRIIRMVLNFKVDKKDRILFLWCSSLRLDPGNIRKTLYKKRNKSLSGINLLKKDNIIETRIKSVDDSKLKFIHPDNINIFKYSVFGKPIQPNKEAYCINCGQQVESYKLFEISFKNLIESQENLKRDKQFFPVYDNVNMTSNGIEVIPAEEKTDKNKKIKILRKLKAFNFKNFVIPKVISELYPKLSFKDYNNLKKDTVFKNKKEFICDACYLEITKYCSMGGSNNLYLLKCFKKEDKNKNTNNIYNFIRPKSAKKIDYSNININLDKIENKDLLSSYLSKKNIKNIFQRTNSFINNERNLYQNHNNNKNKNEEKNKLTFIDIKSYNENNLSGNIINEKNNLIRSKLGRNHKINMRKNFFLNNRLNSLSKENNKEMTEFFMKNRKKIGKFAKFYSNGINITSKKKNKNNIFNLNFESFEK